MNSIAGENDSVLPLPSHLCRWVDYALHLLICDPILNWVAKKERGKKKGGQPNE